MNEETRNAFDKILSEDKKFGTKISVFRQLSREQNRTVQSIKSSFYQYAKRRSFVDTFHLTPKKSDALDRDLALKLAGKTNVSLKDLSFKYRIGISSISARYRMIKTSKKHQENA